MLNSDEVRVNQSLPGELHDYRLRGGGGAIEWVGSWSKARVKLTGRRERF